ncbi:MAG: tyrosine-type recombinase/integrase, partial [Oscillospiraceae bacterium]
EAKKEHREPVLLPDFSAHVLRHTFATRMCESGLNIKVVQSVLGHADITTTLDVYVTVTNELKQQQIAAFEAYLETGVKQQSNI